MSQEITIALDLPEKAVRALVQICMAAFLGVLCWQGVEFAAFNADQASPAMEISMLIPFSAIPAGSAMMIVVIFDGLLAPFGSDEMPAHTPGEPAEETP